MTRQPYRRRLSGAEREHLARKLRHLLRHGHGHEARGFIDALIWVGVCETNEALELHRKIKEEVTAP